MTRIETPVALPRYVQIEPVGQCNLRCRMCPIQFRSDGTQGAPAFMSVATFRSVIDQFPDLTELHMQGMGEPLLHPDFFEMVRYAAARGITVTTNTNLTLLNDRRVAECLASGLKRLHVSLDGASADTYEYIRSRAHFEQVLRNLRRLVEARRARQVALEIELVVVVMRRNLHELPALVRLAHEFEIEAVSVQHLCHDFRESSLPAKYLPLRDFVDAQTLARVEPSRVEYFFNAARKLADELKVVLRLPAVRPRPHAAAVRGRARCDWPWRGAYVSFEGQAMPCCMVATPDRINFGNMAHAGVATIWNNDGYRAFRAQLDSASPPEVCRGCALYAGTF